MFRKVQGHSGLVKDTKTNAVLNTDNTALNNAIQAKENMIKKIKKEENLENRINVLEQTIEKLLKGNIV